MDEEDQCLAPMDADHSCNWTDSRMLTEFKEEILGDIYDMDVVTLRSSFRLYLLEEEIEESPNDVFRYLPYAVQLIAAPLIESMLMVACQEEAEQQVLIDHILVCWWSSNCHKCPTSFAKDTYLTKMQRMGLLYEAERNGKDMIRIFQSRNYSWCSWDSK